MKNYFILNLEAFGFSKQAEKLWTRAGDYKTATWDSLDDKMASTSNVLIVRLARMINAEVLDRFPNLSFLITATTGLDHIDLKETERRNINVISLRGEDEFLKTIPSTAEHTWALLMALLRKIPSASEHIKKGGWNRDLFRGHQLEGKTIGIIGLGRTGLRVANFAKAFEMKVQYVDPVVDTSDFEKCLSLERLVSSSDIISLHVHLTKENTNLISQSLVKQFKQGAFFINTSRGKLVDEEALVTELQTGHLAGVASDVLASELTDIATSPLYRAFVDDHNIVLTPHIGGATWEAMHTCEEFIAEKFLKTIAS